MPLVVPNVGEAYFLMRMVNHQPGADLSLHLYTNDKTPKETDTVKDYKEAVGAGYSNKVLKGKNWSLVGKTSAIYPKQTFEFSGVLGNVYGYFVLAKASDGVHLLFAERFSDGPYEVKGKGNKLHVELKLAFD